MELLPQALMDGVMLGAIYIIIAVAFSLVYGVMHVIDFAVGEWIMFGAFAGYYLNRATGLDPFLLLPAVFVVFALRLFTTSGEPFFALHLAGVVFNATREGLRAGSLAAARVLAATSVLVLLGMVAPAHALFRALLWFRVPRSLVEIGLLMYRFIFVLLDLAADMATAQTLRLGYRGAARSLRSVGALAGAVLVKSLDQAARTSEAMVSGLCRDDAGGAVAGCRAEVLGSGRQRWDRAWPGGAGAG
jgi:cobalt ECF transporter T component CbiQ